jgi:hypothetical protein
METFRRPALPHRRHGPHSFRGRQSLPNSFRKPFGQKNFGALKGVLSAGRYVSCPQRKRVLLRHVKDALGNRIGFSGQGLARRTWRYTPCGPLVYNPTYLGRPLPVPTPRHAAPSADPPAWSDKRQPQDRSQAASIPLGTKPRGMRARHAVQLAKETFVDETETGLWSAHA